MPSRIRNIGSALLTASLLSGCAASFSIGSSTDSQSSATPSSINSGSSETVASSTPTMGDLLSDTTKPQDEERIHQALLRHPEWISEANAKNEAAAQKAFEEKAKQTVIELRNGLLHNPADPAIGKTTADVTVVEFFDYQCPYCKSEAAALSELVATDPKVRLIFKQFPILDPISQVAAKAALAAQKQGKFIEFHNKLLADKTPEHHLTEAHIMEIAAEVGLVTTQLRKDMDDPAITKAIGDNFTLAKQLNLTGTPALIIGDDIVPGAAAIDTLRNLVAKTRSKAAKAS